MAFYVWLYCIFWWFIQDLFKVLLYWWMEKYNILGINDSATVGKDISMAEAHATNGTSNPMLDDNKSAELKRKLLH